MNVSIPTRIRVIAYLIGLSLGGLGVINSAILVWLTVEGWIDKPTDTMLAAVLSGLVGGVGALCSMLALGHITLPDSTPTVVNVSVPDAATAKATAAAVVKSAAATSTKSARSTTKEN